MHNHCMAESFNMDTKCADCYNPMIVFIKESYKLLQRYTLINTFTPKKIKHSSSPQSINWRFYSTNPLIGDFIQRTYHDVDEEGCHMR